MKRNKHQNKTVAIDRLDEARRAFQRMLPKISAVDPDEAIRANVDLGRAVTAVLAAEPQLQVMLPAIIEVLPGFDPALVKELRPTALAAWYTHVASVPAEVDPSGAKALIGRATEMKRALVVQAVALADRGLLDAGAVAEIKGGLGHLALANGLVALAHLFRAGWDRIEGKTPVTEEELASAADVGARLMEALGRRGSSAHLEGTELEASDARRRAFSLLFETYDAIRRALEYVRWQEGDTDEIAPSLYTHRTRRRTPERTPEASAAPTGPAGPPAEEGGADGARPRPASVRAATPA